MHRIALVFTVVLAGFVLATSSAEAMSCRNRLVVVGDPMVRVLDLCGDPSTVSERVVHRTQQVQRYVSPGVIVTDVVTVSVTLTEWIYDFGPTRFMRGLVFEDGRLRVIDTLGYGTPSGRTASISTRRRATRRSLAALPARRYALFA